MFIKKFTKITLLPPNEYRLKIGENSKVITLPSRKTCCQIYLTGWRARYQKINCKCIGHLNLPRGIYHFFRSIIDILQYTLINSKYER